MVAGGAGVGVGRGRRGARVGRPGAGPRVHRPGSPALHPGGAAPGWLRRRRPSHRGDPVPSPPPPPAAGRRRRTQPPLAVPPPPAGARSGNGRTAAARLYGPLAAAPRGGAPRARGAGRVRITRKRARRTWRRAAPVPAPTTPTCERLSTPPRARSTQETTPRKLLGAEEQRSEENCRGRAPPAVAAAVTARWASGTRSGAGPGARKAGGRAHVGGCWVPLGQRAAGRPLRPAGHALGGPRCRHDAAAPRGRCGAPGNGARRRCDRLKLATRPAAGARAPRPPFGSGELRPFLPGVARGV
jgi:hypothetical protein